jgi:hypothetical protein
MAATRISIEALLKDNISSGIEKISSAGRSMSETFRSMGGTMMGAVFGGNLMYSAIGKIKDTVEEGINSYLNYEKALTVLSYTTRQNVGELENLTGAAKEFSETTIYSDEEIMKAESFLSSQGRTEEQIKKVIQAATNLSTVTGEDLQSSVRKLDATYEGTIGRLGRLDSNLKTLSKTQLANGAGVDEINRKYQGLAKQVGDTTAGQIDKLKNKWGEYERGIGSTLIGLSNTIIGENGLNNTLTKQADILNDEDIPAWRRFFGTMFVGTGRDYQIKKDTDALQKQKIAIDNVVASYLKLNRTTNFLDLMKNMTVMQRAEWFKQQYDQQKAFKNTTGGIGEDLSMKNITTYEKLNDKIEELKKKQQDLLVTGKDLPKDELKYLEQLEAKKSNIEKTEKTEEGLKTATGDELKKTSSVKELSINITKMVGVETIETTKMDSATESQVGDSILKILEEVVFDAANIAYS